MVGCNSIGTGHDFKWNNDGTYIRTTCDDSIPNGCRFSIENIMYPMFPEVIEAMLFDYEPITGSHLIVRNPHEVEIKFSDFYYNIRQVTPLRFDDEIVAAEWLPSPYYRSRTVGDILKQRNYVWYDTLPPVQEP